VSGSEPGTDNLGWLQALPKLELHIHLEGSISKARILALAEAAGEPLPRPIDELFQTGDLDSFLANLDWVCSLVRSPETARELALDFARYAHGQGISYAELIVNPTHWRGLDIDPLFRALADGFDEAQAAGLTDVRLLPSLLRQQSEAEALALVSWMEDAAIDRICGLSVDGNQARAEDSSRRLAPAFARARAAGFPCTAHAGESSGPEGVIAALDLLGASRIDHGVRAAEDPALVARLAETGITLNVCVSSNCRLLYGGIEAHPINTLLHAGVACALNTDDPVVLETTLVDELAWVAGALDWPAAELVARQQAAISAAFCHDRRKRELRSRLESFVGNP